MKRLILLLLFFTIAYAQAQDAAPDSSKLINPAFTFFKYHNGADTSIYGKSGNDWWNFARQSWINKYFLRSADSARYVTLHYFSIHGSSTAHTDSLFALAEKSANKTATPSISTVLYPNWQGLFNYAYPLTGNPSGFISNITGITAGGDLTGTYPNPTVNTINGKTVTYYDFTSSGQTQLNSKQATLVSGTNIKTINGSSILGSGNLIISGSGGSYTANQPLSISGSTISLDTSTAITGVETKGAALSQYNSLAGQINLATQALTDDPGIPALTGYTSNVAVAYGTIRLYPSATKAFRLRRSSDNVTQDFYFDANGNVNQDDINKFTDGYRGYLAIWYDQSPNGINAVQITNSLQPYVVIESGVVKVRFEALYNLALGQSLTYTLGTGIDVSNTTIFEAYAPYIASGLDQVYPTPNFYFRYFLSSANAKLDLYIDGANSSKPNSLSLSGTNTGTLYAWQQGNFFSINSNSSAAKVRSNYSSPVSLSPLTSFIETQFKIGNKYSSDGNPYAGDIYAYVQYSSSQADPVIDTLASRLKTPYNLITASDNNISVVLCGNSETNGAHATNNQNYSKQLNNLTKTPIINLAMSSNNYALQNGSNYNTAVDGNLVAGKTNILIFWLGTNDLNGASGPMRTATQVYNDAVAYAQARHTAGWNKVVMLTAMDRGSVGTFATFNTMLKANTTDFDAVLDVASDSRLTWLAGYGGNTTALSAPDYSYFFSDNTHLTNEGYKIISSYVDNYIESVAQTIAVNTSYSRRLKIIEGTLSQIQNLSILNQMAIQHGSLGVDSDIYVNHLYGNRKPLSNLYVDATKTQNGSNIGDIYINTLGHSHVAFGINTLPSTSFGYIFGYSASPAISNLSVALYNPNNTTSTLYFLNNGTATINNAYLQAGAGTTGTLTMYTLHNLTLESNQSNILLQTFGVNGLGIRAYNNSGTLHALVGTEGYAGTATSFLNLSNGLAAIWGSPLKWMTGVTQQAVLEAGSQNFDGTWLYLTSTFNSILVNNRLAFVLPHTTFNPTTGSTVILVNNQRNIINPSNGLATLILTMPSSPVQNDVVDLKFTQPVTTLIYSGGTVVTGPSSATSGQGVSLTYDSNTSSWY